MEKQKQKMFDSFTFVMTLNVSFYGRVSMMASFVSFRINVCALCFFNLLQVHTNNGAILNNSIGS